MVTYCVVVSHAGRRLSRGVFICEARWLELPFYLMFLHRFSPWRYTAGDVSPSGELDGRGAFMDESTLTFLLLINHDFFMAWLVRRTFLHVCVLICDKPLATHGERAKRASRFAIEWES